MPKNNTNSTFQDWDPQVIDKRGKKDSVNANTVQKPKTVLTNQQKALLDDSEISKIQYVDSQFAKDIVTMRIAKKLTRKEAAQQLSMTEPDLANWETGKAVHNGAMVAKLKRFYGIVNQK
jgi:ribosome-binding protein aMBF1 (putative translation factor)